MDLDAKLKHLELIQGVINRMANNSFLLKGWSITLVAALAAVAAKDARTELMWLALLPAFAFWGLDGYFLRQEKLFRELYKHVAARKPEKIDFSMDTLTFSGRVENWWDVSLSATLASFYGAIIISVILVIIYLG